MTRKIPVVYIIEVNYNRSVIKGNGCNDHKKVKKNRFVPNKCVISKAIP